MNFHQNLKSIGVNNIRYYLKVKNIINNSVKFIILPQNIFKIRLTDGIL